MLRAAPLFVALALVTTGCKKKTDGTALPALEEPELLSRLAGRPMPDPVRARFSIKMRSKPLGIAAPPLGGGLVVDRPGQAYLAIMNPVGGKVLSVATDAEAFVFLNHRDKQAFYEADAAQALGDATAGTLALADLVDVLVGLLPVTADQITQRKKDKETTRLTFDRPEGVSLRTWVDSGTGEPLRVEVEDDEGKRLVDADYGPFEDLDDGSRMPSRVTLYVPSVDLTLDLKYKTWSGLEQAPDVFAPAIPEDFQTLPMSAFADGLSGVAAEAGDEGAEASSPDEAR